jgi:hypothetical protein
MVLSQIADVGRDHVMGANEMVPALLQIWQAVRVECVPGRDLTGTQGVARMGRRLPIVDYRHISFWFGSTQREPAHVQHCQHPWCTTNH